MHEAQEGASQDNDYGFDPNEVDYDEEGDEEMDEAEDDEEVVADDEEEEEAGETEAAPEAAKMPKWALNLDVGSIRLPAVGMTTTTHPKARHNSLTTLSWQRSWACTSTITGKGS